MNLGEFIKEFSRNNIIRLHYKEKGGHKCVLESFDESSMCWEVLKAKGKNRHYINNKVLSVIGICNVKKHPDAINIVIEKLENQPFIEEVIDEPTNYCESVEG
jgi:hypothetical protein